MGVFASLPVRYADRFLIPDSTVGSSVQLCESQTTQTCRCAHSIAYCSRLLQGMKLLSAGTKFELVSSV
jgi:hypothetical protein